MFSSPILRVVLLLAVFASAKTMANPMGVVGQAVVSITSVDHVPQLPKGTTLIPLNKNSLKKGYIQYSLGKRVSNDRIVSQGSDSQLWNSAQDVKLTLKYPASGIGAVLSYLQIEVMQDGNDGQAYVTLGGIGQREVGILVETYNTRSLSYAYNFWGN